MIDETAARALATEALGGAPNAHRETSWGWYFWRLVVSENRHASERITVTRGGELNHIPLRDEHLAPGEGTYRTMQVVTRELEERDAYELAQENAYWPLTLGGTFRWGWVYYPTAPQGHPLPAGPGPVSVTSAGKVLAHGSLPVSFTDEEAPEPPAVKPYHRRPGFFTELFRAFFG